MSDPNPSGPPAGPDFVQATENPVAEVSSAVPESMSADEAISAPSAAPASLPTSYPAPGIDPAWFSPVGGPPVAGAPAAADTVPAAEPTGSWSRDAIVVRERVGRGLLFSLLAILVGVGLTMVLYKLGFIASITSFALAYAAIWLYTLGAGAPPKRGVWGVLAVIVIGVALSVASMVVTDVLTYLQQEYPDAAMADKLDTIMYNLGRGEVWSTYTTDILMYVVFAGLGTFGLVRQLGRARKAG